MSRRSSGHLCVGSAHALGPERCGTAGASLRAPHPLRTRAGRGLAVPAPSARGGPATALQAQLCEGQPLARRWCGSARRSPRRASGQGTACCGSPAPCQRILHSAAGFRSEFELPPTPPTRENCTGEPQVLIRRRLLTLANPPRDAESSSAPNFLRQLNSQAKLCFTYRHSGCRFAGGNHLSQELARPAPPVRLVSAVPWL